MLSEKVKNSKYYTVEWFLGELDQVKGNPTTSALTGQFNRYLTKFRGEWEQKEQWIAALLVQGSEEENLEQSFKKFLTGLRGKTYEKREFDERELQLVSALLLVGVPEEKVKKIGEGLRSIALSNRQREILTSVFEMFGYNEESI